MFEIVHDGQAIGEAMPCPVYKKDKEWCMGFPLAMIGAARPSFGVVFVFWDQDFRDEFYKTMTTELAIPGEGDDKHTRD